MQSQEREMNLSMTTPSQDNLEFAAYLLYTVLHADNHRGENQSLEKKRLKTQRGYVAKISNTQLVKDVLELQKSKKPLSDTPGVMMAVLHYRPELIKEFVEVLRGLAPDCVVTVTAYAMKASHDFKCMRALEKILTHNEKIRVLDILTQNNLAFDWSSWKVASTQFRMDARNWKPAVKAGVNFLQHLPQTVLKNLDMQNPIVYNAITASVICFADKVLSLVPVDVWTTSSDLFCNVLNRCPGAIWFLHPTDVLNAIKDKNIVDMTKVLVQAICYGANEQDCTEKHAKLGVVRRGRRIDFILEIIRCCAVHDIESFKLCMEVVAKTRHDRAFEALEGVWPPDLFFYAVACTCTQQTRAVHDIFFYETRAPGRVSPFDSSFNLCFPTDLNPTKLWEINTQIILGCDLNILRPFGYMKKEIGDQVRDICDIAMVLPIFYLSAPQGEKKVMQAIFIEYLRPEGSSERCRQLCFSGLSGAAPIERVLRTCRLALVEKIKRSFR